MRYRIGILALLSILVVTAFIYSAALPHDNSLTQLRQRGVIHVGYAVEPPYAYADSDGNITGESPEVAKVVVASLGIARIEWVQTQFDLLINDLLDHRFDVIAVGMMITPERAQVIHFSNPSFHVPPGLFVRTGNPLQLHSYEDIVNNQQVKVAVVSGSVEESYLRRIGVTDDQLVVVPDPLTGASTVTSGLADCFARSSVRVRWMAAHDPSRMTEAAEPFAAVPMNLSWGYGGFVFRPDDEQLLEAWNAALADFITSPEHIDLVSRFGFTHAELPGTVTAAMVLNP